MAGPDRLALLELVLVLVVELSALLVADRHLGGKGLLDEVGDNGVAARVFAQVALVHAHSGDGLLELLGRGEPGLALAHLGLNLLVDILGVQLLTRLVEQLGRGQLVERHVVELFLVLAGDLLVRLAGEERPLDPFQFAGIDRFPIHPRHHVLLLLRAGRGSLCRLGVGCR